MNERKMISFIGSILFCTYIVVTCLLWTLNVLYLAPIPVAMILLIYAKVYGPIQFNILRVQ